MTTYHNGGDSTTAINNPYLYRGYYYDSNLGLYYLQSRYYDPVTCRFINADDISVIGATPSALTDKNLFAYCDNNPVMRADHDGYFWGTVFDVISLGISIVDVINNPDDVWAWIGLAGDIVDLLPIVSGVGEVTDLLRVANKADCVVDIVKTTNKVDNISDSVKVTTKIHGNSLKTTKETIGYALRKIDTGEIMKFGETTRGVQRYSKKFYIENGVYMDIMARGSKYDMHYWQHNQILNYMKVNGTRPIWNKSNW